MQRAETEELRQREANMTALRAIGTRKKPKLDLPGSTGSYNQVTTIILSLNDESVARQVDHPVNGLLLASHQPVQNGLIPIPRLLNHSIWKPSSQLLSSQVMRQ